MIVTQYLWVALGIAAVVVGVAFFFARKRRESQLVRLAAGLGLRPEHDGTVLEASGLLQASFFEPEAARCRNIMRGQVRGAEAVLFEYAVRDERRWRTPDPVVFFRLEQKQLPSFELRPRMTSEDPRGIEFEVGPRFSEVYALTGADVEAVRSLFREDILAYFERAENQSWAVASVGDWLAVVFWPLGERDKSLDPKEVMGFFEDAKELLFVLSG